jgi:hypothetical protein
MAVHAAQSAPPRSLHLARCCSARGGGIGVPPSEVEPGEVEEMVKERMLP